MVGTVNSTVVCGVWFLFVDVMYLNVALKKLILLTSTMVLMMNGHEPGWQWSVFSKRVKFAMEMLSYLNFCAEFDGTIVTCLRLSGDGVMTI